MLKVCVARHDDAEAFIGLIDIRLYAKDAIAELLVVNCELRQAFLDKADECFGIVMPGYTHLQHAQPVLLSHHLLAYAWMFPMPR